MYDPDANQSPINPLPPVVCLLAGIVAAIELYFQAAGNGFIGGPEAVGWRLHYARTYGFSDSVMDWMIQNRTFPLEHLMRLVTFPFIHFNFTHAVFIVVFILALGNFVARVFHPAAVLAVFFVSSAVGAVAYSVILDDNSLLIGGYPGVYGLIGAFSWILFTNARNEGKSVLPAFRLIAFFMTIQLIYKIVYDTNNQWLAELCAYGVGFGMSYLLAPGARRRFESYLDRMRDRG